VNSAVLLLGVKGTRHCTTGELASHHDLGKAQGQYQNQTLQNIALRSCSF